jgi:aromatic-amino-acid transaminase
MLREIEMRSFPLLRTLETSSIDAHQIVTGDRGGLSRRVKLDLSSGIYQDENKNTPILRAVKEAERILVECQQSKARSTSEGDPEFIESLKSLVFGKLAALSLLAGAQTPGATGALRLAAELIVSAKPDARIWLGTPGWPNYQSIMAAAGLEVRTYSYFDSGRQAISFDPMISALSAARPGDVVVLQACCHNPTGVDIQSAEWAALADMMSRCGLVPLFDLTYQGFGDSLERDVGGLRMILNRVGEALVAYSCNKNFGLYSERTGALFTLSGSASVASTIQSNLHRLVRASWFAPPNHGAAIVKTILASKELRSDWEAELEAMRVRLRNIRVEIASAMPKLSPLANQRGLFFLLPLSGHDVAYLRERHAINVHESARINVACLNVQSIDRLKRAVSACARIKH